MKQTGVNLLGNRNARTAWRVNAIAGCILLFVAVAIVIAVALKGRSVPALFLAAAGPFIAGIVNLAVAYVIRNRVAQLGASVWQLTQHGRQLLTRLQMGFARFEMPYMTHWSYGIQNVQDATCEVLETASAAYNRVKGILDPDSNLSLPSRLTSSASNAADEAMCQIINSAAALDKFPESENAHRKVIESRTAKLHELADRLESLAASQLEPNVASNHSIDYVLDDLRLERLSRSELSDPLDGHKTQINEL